jgi:glutaredoxin
MTPLETRILALYDEMELDTLDLHTLLELAGGNPPAAREAVLDTVTALIERGWVRALSGGDYYTRTEEGRLKLAGPRDVTIYTRSGCHLCEEAKQQIAPLLGQYGGRLREVNVDDDNELRERYGEDVPVILLGSRKVAKHRVDLAQFRRQLERAGE